MPVLYKNGHSNNGHAHIIFAIPLMGSTYAAILNTALDFTNIASRVYWKDIGRVPEDTLFIIDQCLLHNEILMFPCKISKLKS